MQIIMIYLLITIDCCDTYFEAVPHIIMAKMKPLFDLLVYLCRTLEL